MNKQYLKMRILISFSSILFLLLIAFTSKAQTYLTTELSNLEELEKTKTEKVYLQLDRTIFSPGEDIWFKAYLLEGTYHTLTSTTNNLHVEVIAPNGKIKTSQVVLMHEGVGYGDINIPYEGFKDGTYELRAYTNFMRNFNDALFFKQNIIITGNNEIKKNQANTEDIVDLQFFPEGGQLVYNVLNRVAFKAIDQNGKGKNISFTVFDNKNNEIQKAESVHKGMGQFMFTPKPNTTYHATLKLSGSESQIIDLPQANSAYSIMVGNQFKNLLDFNICTSPDNIKGQQVSYLIQSRGKLYSSNKIKMDKKAKLVRIEKEKLPAGISSITIFDENDIPVCERLIYNQISPEVQIKVTTNKQDYNTREKVTLSIETKDEAGKPIPANLSLAVIGDHIADKQKEMLPNNVGIRSSVLLRSDIKGHIENPDYYFENFDKKKHHYLDLVLLTNGWSKYVWKEKVAAPAFAMDYKYENGFTFTGTSRTLLKRPIANSKVSMVISEEGFYYDEVNADEKGKFTFTNTHFMDTAKIVFQAYNKKDKRNTVIDLDEIKYEAPGTSSLKQDFAKADFIDSQEIAAQAEKIKHIQDSLEEKNYKLLEEITIKGRKKRDLDDHYRMYHRADDVIEVTDKFAGYYNIFDIVQEQVTSVHITGFCPEISVKIRGIRGFTNKMTGGGASFLLDGMFVSADDICSIPVTQVDKVEVLKGNSAAIFGSRGMNGIIAVYLKEAGVKWEQILVGINKVRPQGYYRSREFYSPNYEAAQQQFEGPDYRNTIHWEPFISTGKNGKAELSFFNSDDPGNYNITIEGVGLNGGLGKSKIDYLVNPDNLSNK